MTLTTSRPAVKTTVLFDSTRPRTRPPGTFAPGVYAAHAALCVARQRADRAALDAAAARRDAALDAAHARLMTWAGRFIFPTPVSGGAPEPEPEPMYVLGDDDEFTPVPPLGPVDDTDDLTFPEPVPAAVITPGPTEPEAIRGGAPHPCEVWERLADEAEGEVALWEELARLARAQECYERGLDFCPDMSGAFLGHDA